MAYMEEDWGLQAVVRGCSTHDQYTADYDLYDYNIYHDDLFYNFPNIQGVLMNNNVNSSVIMNQVDDLYNPIYDSNVTSFSPQLDHSESQGNDEVKSAEQVEDVKVETVVVASPKATTPAAKYKRKNQQKRVVHATAEGLSSDLWAWRKYGQKPIKGSPHPRSYYRCSSSKGCLARKQVEESCSKPGMFIMTYTAEHNHSQPTRRSSLAGTNRQKSSALKRTSSGESCLSSSTTTKESSNLIKHEMNDINMTIDNQQLMVQDNISGDDLDFVIPDSILTDDFFVGLNDLDGLASNSSFYM